MKKTQKMEQTVILSIESSCDETAAAVTVNGRQVLSNVIYSQIDLHTIYGGVVPEIASRKHIEKINQVIRKALSDAGQTLDTIDAVAVTYGFDAPVEGEEVDDWIKFIPNAEKGVSYLWLDGEWKDTTDPATAKAAGLDVTINNVCIKALMLK